MAMTMHSSTCSPRRASPSARTCASSGKTT
jgi:hypothetical protein